MIQGSKGHKSDAQRARVFAGLRECVARSNPYHMELKYLLTPTSYFFVGVREKHRKVSLAISGRNTKEFICFGNWSSPAAYTASK